MSSSSRMLHLHVWGPALGLPSIDAECLATIAYLHYAAPSSAWRVVPSNDPSICPSHVLPALHHDGVWTSGHRQIVDYLTSNSLCRNLDESLDAAQQADSVAYSSFLSAHAAPLVDLSLYVSTANWSATTRPAYSSLLPFPLTWTVPPLIRAEAIKRVEHLGLAELDADFDPNRGLHLPSGRDALPETFRRHLPSRTKKTVREEMTPEQAAAIRLLGLAEDCLSVLDALMGQEKSDEKHRRFLTGSPLSSLDCLAYGYLALMIKPPVPRSFLRDWVQTQTPRLADFVDEMMPKDLPWVTPEPATLLGCGARVMDSIIRNAPILGVHYANEMRQRAENGTTGLDRRTLLLAIGLMTTGAAAGYGLYMYRSLPPFGVGKQFWKSQRRGSRLSLFGEIGSMLRGVVRADEPRPMLAIGFAGKVTPGDRRLGEVDSEVDSEVD